MGMWENKGVRGSAGGCRDRSELEFKNRTEYVNPMIQCAMAGGGSGVVRDAATVGILPASPVARRSAGAGRSATGPGASGLPLPALGAGALP